jgi:hypothetical protein
LSSGTVLRVEGDRLGRDASLSFGALLGVRAILR